MEQSALVPEPPARSDGVRATGADDAGVDVAGVVVERGLPHLDRVFDYQVPPELAQTAVPGARVTVRFAGTLVDGFVLRRTRGSTHTGRLSPLHRVISAEPVLTEQVAALARAVADRYGGAMADVLRLAVPPRHARAERRPVGEPAPAPDAPAPGAWAWHADGAAYLAALAAGGSPRAVLGVGPGAEWPDLLARAVLATLSSGRGALVVCPDSRDVARVDAALRALADPVHVVLQADLGPEARYGRWLQVLRGGVRAVVGTRAAAFAPVPDLGLVAIWDDGDDLHAEPRSPYPHAREVLLLRSRLEDAGVLVAGVARTAEGEQLVRSGWARAVVPDATERRRRAPAVHTTGDDVEVARDAAARSARLPSLAWRTARTALDRGPVLVQVPRAGYHPSLRCARCRERATCARCQGPLEHGAAGQAARCTWCATTAAGWHCPSCGSTELRRAAVGARRTAEELGRAFAGVPVLTSGGDHVLDTVDAPRALVIATPGAEPVAADGYAAALLLDGDALLARTGLRAEEEALRRWFGAAALVRGAEHGGSVVVVASPSSVPVQALVRWDPAGFAARELDQRATVHLPPTARCVELRGAGPDVKDLLRLLEAPDGTETLGPVPVPRSPSGVGENAVQVILRAPRREGDRLAVAVRAASGVRSARRTGGTVRVRVDPIDLGAA